MEDRGLHHLRYILTCDHYWSNQIAELGWSGWRMCCWGTNGRENELGKHSQEKLEESNDKLISN